MIVLDAPATVHCGCGGQAEDVTPNRPRVCNKCGNLLGIIVEVGSYRPVAWLTNDNSLTIPPELAA